MPNEDHLEDNASVTLTDGDWYGTAYSGNQAKHFGSSLRMLVQYGKRYLPVLIIGVLCSIVSTLLIIIGPSQLARMTDIIVAGMTTEIDIPAVTRVAVFLAIIYALSYLFGLWEGLLLVEVAQRLSRRLRNDLSAKINRLPLRFFDQTSTGDVLSRVTNDVDTIGNTLNQSLSQMIASVIMLLGAAIMMMITNVLMAAVGFAATFIGMVGMAFIIRHSQAFFVAQQAELGKLNGRAEECYAGHSVVQAYGAENQEITTFKAINEALYRSAWKAQFLSGLMMPLMAFVGNLGYVAVCFVGAILVLQGQITFGIIVAFMVYIRLFTQPLAEMAQVFAVLQATAAASERVFGFLKETEMTNEAEKSQRLKDVKGAVDFEHVRFGYDAEKPVLKDFSFSVHPGQKIAIVGPTGAGKTTVVNLLMRFYECDSGTIRIDGTDIQQVPRENIHDQFNMVLQDAWLFEGTIHDNIVYNKSHISEADVIRACQTVGLHSFITTLPQGYHTQLDENTMLSAGQKQLLTIARAMVDPAPMLILDEATSSVDTRTEVLIQKAMDRLMFGRTSFVIAHRLSTIRHADLILVMQNGDVVEHGTHDALLNQRGFYANLYHSQFPASIKKQTPQQ